MTIRYRTLPPGRCVWRCIDCGHEGMGDDKGRDVPHRCEPAVDTEAAAVWCVGWLDDRKRLQWCATATGRQHRDGADRVRTLCRYTITLPCGSREMEPTCEDCRRRVAAHGRKGGV